MKLKTFATIRFAPIDFGNKLSAHPMSKAQIVTDLPRLSHAERREIMKVLFDLEEDAETLAECDRLAFERFQTLDAMEAEDDFERFPVRDYPANDG